MGCWACNPLCGRCKPPRKRSVECPECGKVSFFGKQESLDGQAHTCAACGADISNLVAVSQVYCRKVEGECAYPCGSFDLEPEPGNTECEYRTLVS